jgi:hypothetical protein
VYPPPSTAIILKNNILHFCKEIIMPYYCIYSAITTRRNICFKALVKDIKEEPNKWKNILKRRHTDLESVMKWGPLVIG